MAKHYIAVKNGNVSLPTGFISDFREWESQHSQPTEDISNWSTGSFQWNRGTGVEAIQITCMGFAFAGAGTGSNPGFGAMSGAGGDTGGSAVFTAESGCNITMSAAIVRNLRYRESRIEAAAKVTYEVVNGAADPTINWVA